MKVERADASKNNAALEQFIEGVWRLKREIQEGHTLNTYDRYVKWHADAMMMMTPMGHSQGRNAAHSGPVFLPWHRMYLSELERDLQRVLEDESFGLPYWNWGEDGLLPTRKQSKAKIWRKLGGDGKPLRRGPFKFDRREPYAADNWVIRVEMKSSTEIVTDAHRGLERDLGGGWVERLPNTYDVKRALAIAIYDTPGWDRLSENSFRNVLEGWKGTQSRLHNGVHMWVGGDMVRGHSPNDPVFFLHHCNVDRIWAYWQLEVSNFENYHPGEDASDDLKWHRLNDLMFPMEAISQEEEEELLAHEGHGEHGGHGGHMKHSSGPHHQHEGHGEDMKEEGKNKEQDSTKGVRIRDVLDYRAQYEYDSFDDLKIVS